MNLRDKISLPTVGMALICAVALGAAGAIAVVRPPVPATLQSGVVVTEVPVTQRSFDDARTVELDVAVASDQALLVPRAGRLTSARCSVGASVASGSSSLAIDGVPILNLATSVPLWRDLQRGATGADVTSLQTELTRIGYSVPASGRVDNGTLVAFAAAVKGVGGAAPKNIIPLALVSWLPAPELVVSSCPVALGAQVAESDAVIEFEAALLSASIVSIPERGAPGDRSIVVSSGAAAVDAAGRITDPAALAVIESSVEYASYRRSPDSGPLRVSYALSAPLEVSVVAPSSLVGIDGDKACVISGTTVYHVAVVSSELGQTFVRFEGQKVPEKVALHPRQRSTCN